MNEEYKKKYLKYKKKYLELIGGAVSVPDRARELYLDIIALFNFLLKLKDEYLIDQGKSYNGVFKTDRSFFFDNQQYMIERLGKDKYRETYKNYLNLLNIEDQLKQGPQPKTENSIQNNLADLKKIQKELNKQSAFGTVKNIITNFKYDLSVVDLIYIKKVINKFIEEHEEDTKKDVKKYGIDKKHILPEIRKDIEDTLRFESQLTESQPQPQQQPEAKTGSTTEEIKNLFELLKKIINDNDKIAFTEMNKKIPKNIYYDDEKLTSFISNIADCIGRGIDPDYITNIEEYIKSNFINEIFKGDQLYKLFIFIVIEFGKQLNFEGPVITRMEKLLLPIELNVIDTAGASTSAPNVSGSSSNNYGSSADLGVATQAAATIFQMIRPG